jgi:hypothetical protein
MYNASDPRAALAPAAPPAAASSGDGYAADYVVFHDAAPAEVDDNGGRHWYARGQHLVVAYSECAGSMSARRADQPDEWMLLLPGADTRARISARGEVAHTAGYSLAVIPPGNSEIDITGTGQVVRIFSASAADLCAHAVNAASYRSDHLNVAPWAPWPSAVGGPRIRIYSLDVPQVDGRLGRIWRCSTLMVNLSWPYDGPRDETKLSPHSHADFEQASLVVAGEYVHHIRWPWSSDRRAWREDEHVVCGSPSVTIIPPPTVHTSQGQGTGTNHLIDIFAPPRRDFSERPGWVLNADEYPMPPS